MIMSVEYVAILFSSLCIASCLVMMLSPLFCCHHVNNIHLFVFIVQTLFASFSDYFSKSPKSPQKVQLLASKKHRINLDYRHFHYIFGLFLKTL